MFGRKKKMSQLDVNAKLRKLAEAFVEGSAFEGVVWTWSAGDAEILDEFVERFLSSAPTDEVKHSVGLTLGAYLGELIRQAAGGDWVVDKQWGPMIALPNGAQLNPIAKAHKRVEFGAEHSLSQFYWLAVDPESVERMRREGRPYDPSRYEKPAGGGSGV